MIPALLASFALAQTPPTVGNDTPAEEREGESIWDYIESSGSTPATEEVIEATEELAAERAHELSAVGLIGAEAPLEYYLDPLSATRVDPLYLDRVNAAEFDIPIATNEHVQKWMVYFLGSGRKYYARYLQRSTRWAPMMHRAIEARGMPKDLVYLSMIESGYNPYAYSYASAAGLWQFMTGTGRDFNLRIDWWVDTRRDPAESTRAALDYLSYLHKLFQGDWFLAWASYNGGQGRVMNATKRLGTKDFWKIIQYDVLHTETENYVPKLIAAAIIGKHPERYGFKGIEYAEEFIFDLVSVPASVSVDILASCAGISEEDFFNLNPSLKRWALPPDPATQLVRVPYGAKSKFDIAFAEVPEDARVTLARHVVKRGESIGSIAKKYGMSSSELAKVNRLSTKSPLVVGSELVIPSKVKEAPMDPPAIPASALATTAGLRGGKEGLAVPPLATASTPNEGATSSTSPSPTTVTTTYTVKAGDTLAAIATRHGVGISELKGWNSLRDADNILVGQKLTVKSQKAPAPAPTAATVTHTVRSGDTLSEIAQKYGVSVASIQSANGLKGETIVAGQSLTVKGGATPSKSSSAPGSKPVTYTVRGGDTLGGIAEKYDCTVAELKSWNALSGTRIYAGQKLKIYK